ncbi:MAG TPA: LuxR C-terminal-related transcriptional regulator, partial [Tepidiformaceae bacterium]|nr:LuxR C-terminal-related transcriptional regulator [Tepidiformaceae bacterium]
LVALRTGGDAWGMLGLYREEGAEVFSAEERRFLAGVAPLLGAGARNSLLIGEATDPDHDDAPGLLLLTSALKRNTATAQAERWMDELEPPRESGRLPAAIISVGAAAAGGDGSPSVRVRTRAGRWLVVHGARLGRDQVGVVIEPVAPAKIAPLLMTAYGLTPREQEVTALVLRGFSTEEIAGELVVSEHTVQQHLKSIFEKTGVNSRRDLTGKVFFSHYEPRLRDNERRALEGKPLRGSPIALDRRT